MNFFKLALFIIFPTILGAQEYGHGHALVYKCTIFDRCDLDLSCEDSGPDKIRKHLFMIEADLHRYDPSNRLYWISEDGGVFEPVKMIMSDEELAAYRRIMGPFGLRKIITPMNLISHISTYDIYDISNRSGSERIQNSIHISCGNPIGSTGGLR